MAQCIATYCKSGYDCDMDGVIAPQFYGATLAAALLMNNRQWWQKNIADYRLTWRWVRDISVTDRSHYITQIRAAEKRDAETLGWHLRPLKQN
ncbi:hypothetical protein O9993_04825 [Vibrio lentus]|nr:hypothetical protein [Vibrio lentus]